MNLNFSIVKRIKSTVRKAVKKAAEKVAEVRPDWEWRTAFTAMLKAMRPWPEARAAVVEALRARRDAGL